MGFTCFEPEYTMLYTNDVSAILKAHRLQHIRHTIYVHHLPFSCQRRERSQKTIEHICREDLATVCVWVGARYPLHLFMDRENSLRFWMESILVSKWNLFASRFSTQFQWVRQTFQNITYIYNFYSLQIQINNSTTWRILEQFDCFDVDKTSPNILTLRIARNKIFT